MRRTLVLMDASRAGHWDGVYSAKRADEVSWYERDPHTSLELIEVLGVSPTDAVIDVGGGESNLVEALLGRGFTDLSVLDVSGVALEEVAVRVGAGAAVEWIVADVTAWRPRRHYRLWHDRAAFHFLVGAAEREAYLRALRAAGPHTDVVLATFAADGPQTCSGLPVARYDADGLTAVLDGFDVVATRRVIHLTPWGGEQPFTYVAARSRTSGR